MLRSLLIAAVAPCLLLGPTFAKDEPGKKVAERKIDDLQNGEPIAAADQGAVDAPLRRAADFPWIKLSSLKRVKLAKDRFELQVDYQVTEGSPQEIVVVFKSLQGRKTRRWSIAGEKDATVRFSDVWSPIPDKVEAWIEYGGGLITPSDTTIGYKISNSVMFGDKGQITSARHWKPDEEKAWNDYQRAKSPPANPPEGYEFAESKPLLPGMPVLTWVAGEWQECEYVGTYNKMIVAPRLNGAQTPLHTAVHVVSRVVVAKRVLEQGRQKPDSFKPSVRLLPNSLVPLTNDLVPIPEDVEIVPGTPLRSGWGSTWNRVFVTSAPVGGQVETHSDDAHHRVAKSELSALAIEKSVLEELRRPDAAAKFAKQQAELTKKWAAERRERAHVRDYPGTFPLPDGYAPLGDKEAVKTGDKFMIYWANSWRTATAVSDAPPAEAVEIRWDHLQNWQEFVSRKSLFVAQGKEKTPPDTQVAVVPGEAKKPSGEQKKPNGGYSLTLESVTGKKFAVAKVVMDITGLDLADAKEAVEEAPILLSQSLTKDAAERFQKQLETAGAKAAIRKVE